MVPSVSRALETSCNIYFYELGSRTGIEALTYWATADTGKDGIMPNEVSE